MANIAKLQTHYSHPKNTQKHPKAPKRTQTHPKALKSTQNTQKHAHAPLVHLSPFWLMVIGQNDVSAIVIAPQNL
jgi:hypothetical protein